MERQPAAIADQHSGERIDPMLSRGWTGVSCPDLLHPDILAPVPQSPDLFGHLMDSVPEFFVMLPFLVVELPDVEGIADYLVDRAFGEGLASAGLESLGVKEPGKGLERVMSAGVFP
ncbi:MAG: hypothetical protein Q7R34_16635 [Dehalococcoidia bacterium]|nr:hypothetical protein [Dehalococcoidia bacterium]